MLKIVSLFLVAIVALAFFGRFRQGKWRAGPPQIGPEKPKKCPSCGRFLIGAGGCDCGAPRA